MQPRLLLAAALLPLALGAAGAQPADTTRVSHDPLFTRRDAVVAAAFLGATIAFTPLDEQIARRLNDENTQANRFLRDAATGVEYIAAPGAFIIGGTLYVVGRAGDALKAGGSNDFRRMADLGWHGTEAVLLGTAAYNIGKGVFGRARPHVNTEDARSYRFGRGFGGGPYASFPSGHTTTAFAAASAVTAETSKWWPRSTIVIAPAMYGGATLVGLSRMYNNKHWASDVVMGAALGTFSGLKVVHYHHSRPNNRLDRWFLGRTSATATPTGQVGLVWKMETW